MMVKLIFFVVNHSDNDKLPIVIQGHRINYCTRYLYLGAWFTDTGKMEEVMQLHEAQGQSVVNKFAVFCAANTDMPFYYKRRVFDAAVASSLLYSTESWLTNNWTNITRQYNKLVKCILGVRHNTSINLCFIESGISPVNHVLAVRRKRFLETKLNMSVGDEPFHFVYNLCREADTPGYRFIRKSLEFDLHVNPLHRIIEMTVNKPDTATKYVTYKTDLNPELSVHKVYSERVYVPDYVRQAFTRLRLMSHDLKIETGRWSRVPREQRLCQCNEGQIQTERHVLLRCALSERLRQRFVSLNFDELNLLLKDEENTADLCKYVYEVVRVYRNI